MVPNRSFDLVITDVDGTLVTTDKQLTQSSIDTARELHDARIALMITSSRPPRGLRMLIEPLALTTPIAAFNGGMLVATDQSVIERHHLPQDCLVPIYEMLTSRGLDVWVYTATEWFVPNESGPHVDQEMRAVQFSPTVRAGLEGITEVAKLVAVQDDHAVVADAEKEVQRRFGGAVAAARSHPYYLDITHPEANKGKVVEFAESNLGVQRDRIVVVGDGRNDLAMFNKAGLSIAMGNAAPDVQAEADEVSRSNDDDGFTFAMRQYVLNRA